MIARVKIAPRKRWCPEAIQESPSGFTPGKLISIDTSSMYEITRNGETFKNWEVVGEDLEWLKEVIGRDVYSLCEHVLEMD